MNIENVAAKLDEIRELWEDIKDCPISLKVASKQEQAEMRERIEAVFERYEIAIENGDKYIPLIRKELNHIRHTLKRWIYYDELQFEETLANISKFL